MSQYAAIAKYLPPQAVDGIVRLLEKNEVFLRISRPRKTKLGDYSFDPRVGQHHISVNADLAPQAFLVTLVHEMAHLYTTKTYGRSVKPHGAEWKSYFQQLMNPFLAEELFDEEVKAALNHYLQNPKATACADERLFKVLHMPAREKSGYVNVEEVSANTRFLYNGRLFKMERKLRKRFRCIEIKTKREYNFSAFAQVKPLDE